MAEKRRRDYAAEERRRNERARERGYSSRAQERAEKVAREKLGTSREEWRKAQTESRRWSRSHSQKPESKYPAGGTPEQRAAYWQAYRAKEKHTKRLGHMRKWLVGQGFMSPEEFEDRYTDK